MFVLFLFVFEVLNKKVCVYSIYFLGEVNLGSLKHPCISL